MTVTALCDPTNADQNWKAHHIYPMAWMLAVSYIQQEKPSS